MNLISSPWKTRMDQERDPAAVDAIVAQALQKAPKTEQLELLAALYEEYVAPDEAGGGCVGTQKRIQQIAQQLSVTDADLLGLGITPHHFRACIFHR